MKAIILAAGYGTRLRRDIENDPTGRFSHLSGIPKPLLPVGPTALISHWVRALGATQYVDTVLVVEDFSLATVITEFSDLQAKCNESNLVLSYECKDDETSKYGILEVDADLRVRCMKEKPLPSQTNSRRACPCFYLLSESTIPLLDKFLEEKKAAPIEERDAPGNFLSWLILRKPVYIHQVSGRFDVGNLAAYIECDNFFKENFLQLKSYLV
ncbi:hypothetical protein Z043_120827 [Scleropages formosus]|uniref:Nucleotidyl transferase domain-containing protein n=1 Tax=Scleropages formosus TaxID=113540 RepID=A0A0P7UIP7_SCLFO|nr:hypothetical protein Z043_120827 [Scleropages formosus]